MHMAPPATWPGMSGNGALLFPLPQAHWLAGLPEQIALPQCTLARKHELHVTLLNRERGTRLATSLDESVIRQAFLSEDWTLARTGDAVLLQKTKVIDGKQVECWSLIEQLHLPAFEQFRKRLSVLTGDKLPHAMPHVTLYTAGDAEGIGLPDMATLQAHTMAHVRLPGVMPRQPPAMASELWDAYRATEFVLMGSNIVLLVGVANPDMDRLLGMHGVERAIIVSADNPFSEASAAEANLIRRSLLKWNLCRQGYRVLDAEGRDPGGKWPPEVSLLVLGTSSTEAERLLRDYEQHAVVLVERGEEVRLLAHPSHSGCVNP